MRTLLDIAIAVLLIALGWEKSFQQRASELPWVGDKTAAVQKTAVAPRPAPSASGAWMWDPNRKSVLDRPSPTPKARQDH